MAEKKGQGGVTNLRGKLLEAFSAIDKIIDMRFYAANLLKLRHFSAGLLSR